MYPKSLSITYIIGTYPGLTTTFIDREVMALQSMGVRLQIKQRKIKRGQWIQRLSGLRSIEIGYEDLQKDPSTLVKKVFEGTHFLLIDNVYR